MTPDELHQAAQQIRDGGLVAFPTETVYGLGANALDPQAVRRIFEAKGRPSTSPLIVHVHTIAMARELVTAWPPLAAQLTARHWPGPLTLVLPKQPHVPDEVTAGLPTVGIRMPAHPIALALIREANLPIAAPSANRFTQLSPTTAAHVRAAFGDSLMILDGGPTNIGIESTVVSLAGPEPVLLRPGMIPFDDIRRITGSGSGAHPSPGLHERHYSPRAPLFLVESSAALPHGRIAYVWWNAPRDAAKSVRMPASPEAYAAALYATLHTLDAEGWESIAVERPPSGSAWTGILDRLERASR